MINCNIGFLFDLDGVIIDSEAEYTRIWALINQEFPTGIENFELKIKGCSLTKILTDNYDTEELRDAVSSRLHELENKMKYQYLPYAENFLSKLHSSGYPMALVTSSDKVKMKHLKEELPELENYFNFIVTGDMVSTSKPSPEGYLLAAEKINCEPKNCVVFEDSLQGVMAGKNAGSFVVGIKGTIQPEFLAPYSHIMIDNFSELDFDNLILNLNKR